jgi:hypothetical protein
MNKILKFSINMIKLFENHNIISMTIYFVIKVLSREKGMNLKVTSRAVTETLKLNY